MTVVQSALLQLIAEGNYMPHVHAEYPHLAWLYREGYITYGWRNVEVTDAGRIALAAQKAGS